MSLADRPRDDITDVPSGTAAPEHAGGSATASNPLRPTWHFMARHPAHWIALGFGSGLARRAPGTFGTLWAWAAWLLLSHWFSPLQMSGLLAIALPVGWWASTQTARHLRTADPGAIVIDEIIAFWIILWLLLPAGFIAQLAAFGLFRLFDAIKPGPIGWADRLFHDASGWRGGLGIMLDDLVAAGCVLLLIALWRALGVTA